MAGRWGVTPKQSVRAAVERTGLAEVVAGCRALLGRSEHDGVDAAFLLVLGGPPARSVLAGRDGGVEGYWPRVWAARGLLHAWDDSALPEIVAATFDGSWRVREMAAKVIAAHRLDDALEALDHAPTTRCPGCGPPRPGRA